MMMNIGFIGGYSLLKAALSSIECAELKAHLAVVIDIHSGSPAIGLAKEHGIPFSVLNAMTHRDLEQRNLARLEVLQQHQVEVVILGDYPRERLGTRLLEAYDGRILEYRFLLCPEPGEPVPGRHLMIGSREVTGTLMQAVSIRRDGDRVLAEKKMPILEYDSAHPLRHPAALGQACFMDALVEIANGGITL